MQETKAGSGCLAVSPEEEKTIFELDDDEIVSKIYPETVKLGIRLRIEQLSSIDTVHQTYAVRCVQVTDWEATQRDIDNYNEDKENYIPSRIIKVMWINAISEEMNYQVFTMFKHSDGKYYNLRMYYANAVFTEQFECENFPFDVQDLSFVFDTDRGVHEVMFVPARNSPEIMYINRSYLALCDWQIVFFDVTSQYIEWKRLKTNKRANINQLRGDDITSCIAFRVQVKRKPFAFCVRVMLWMFLLVGMAFYIFGFASDNLSDRLSFSIGLIFAVVAFQFIIGDQIPNLPYLTIVDKYNLAVFVFIMIIGFESVLVGWKDGTLLGDKMAEDVDWFFFRFSAALFVVFHLAFAVHVYHRVQFERQKIGKPISEPVINQLGVVMGNKVNKIPFKFK